MRISFLHLLVICIFTYVTADVGNKKVDVRLPVHRPEESDDKNPENVNVLLTTLFEMHHNLLAQISLLEEKLKSSLPVIEKTDIRHMVQHYTAQKNNIEISIQQIQSNDGLQVPESRHIAKDSSMETKSFPLLLNFFKRTPTPSNEQASTNIAYSLPYQPYYEPQPATTYAYQAAPSIAPQNDLIESTFAGFQPQTVPNGQIYLTGDQPSQQLVQTNVPSQQLISQPQHYIQQEPQYQPQPQPQAQFQFESVFRPQSLPVRRPQVPEFDTQRYQQQGPFGQKEGVFIYYPNGMITDDKDRPTIANRFGQAFDRFGQVLSNFGNRQPSISPANENNLAVQRSESLQTKNKIKGSRPTTSIDQKDVVLKQKEKETMKNPKSEKQAETEITPP